jgi:hypothetical protein
MEGNEAPGESGDEAVEPAVDAEAVVGAEPPPEPEEPEPEHEPTLTARIADTCSAMLDAVAVIDRIQAKQDAWKIEFLDQARRVAESTDHGLVTVGSTLTEQQQREMVRRSFVAEVACMLRIPESTAGQLVDDSAALMHRLPVTLAALREGEISLRHARVIVDNTSTLDEDTARVFEEAALRFAKTQTVSQFSQKARILRERIDAESITVRRLKSAKDRRVEFQPARDGMAWLNLYTTAPEATSLYTAIRSAAMALQGKTETRTVTQLAADVCVDALAAGLDGGGAGGTATTPAATTTATTLPRASATAAPTTAFGRITPTVVVTVPALTLLGESQEPGELAGYGPIDPETARRLAGKSKTWLRLLTDAESGVPLTLGRTRYKPTKQMRRFLALRDGTCQFKGCNRRATHCEIDHTKAWAFGGPTDCDNLSHLCPKHHRLKHQTTWQATQIGGGSIRWTSPDGRTYVTEPETRFLPPPGHPSGSTEVVRKEPPPDPMEKPPF